ncbi:MAG: acyl-CoA desaturase [Planctomycetota bacterium]|jgi:stearoyl-CoA desaturase (delta-9 desaturase)
MSPVCRLVRLADTSLLPLKDDSRMDATDPRDCDRSPSEHRRADDMPQLERVVTLLLILLPAVGVLVAIAHVWGWGISWIDLVLVITMYVLTGLGITVGFHRLFTHRSFKTNRVIEAAFAVLGSMAVEGPLVRWVATHRCHHQHSDSDSDPHSPHHHGGGYINMAKGLWRAHVGWLFTPFNNELRRYVPDFSTDRFILTLSRLFPLWVALGILIPGIIAGLVTQSWSGALLGVLWGGLVRIFIVHHVTWSVNSVCHIWGSQPFDAHDESRNNAIVGVLAFGEGWHNNHHAFPASARHGLRWWEVDVSYGVIWLMSKIGLAQEVRVPTRERMAAKRR